MQTFLPYGFSKMYNFSPIFKNLFVKNLNVSTIFTSLPFPFLPCHNYFPHPLSLFVKLVIVIYLHMYI